MKEPTKADLATAVARLTGENAGLRDLLAAVSAYADMPHPASYDNRTYERELECRADVIAIWANGDREDMAPDVYLLVIQDRAKHLREEAARPVRYEVRAEPALAESDEPEPGTQAYADKYSSRTVQRELFGETPQDQPASPDAAEALIDAIVAGTPVKPVSA